MTQDPYQTEEYRGYTINIYYDESGESPRDWDNFGTIYSNSRSYNPDKHSIEEIMNDSHNGFSDDFKENYIWLKVYGYEHGGLTIRASENGNPFACPFDSGLFGIIAVSKAEAVRQFGKKICTKKVRDKALECLRGEIETLDLYYTGQVYGYEAVDAEGESVDSCWGYYGDEGIKYILSEAKDAIDYEIEQRQKLHDERIEKVKSNIVVLVGNVFPTGNECYRIGTNRLFGFPVIEKATKQQGRIRESYYNDINLSDIPEDVLANMASLV